MTSSSSLSMQQNNNNTESADPTLSAWSWSAASLLVLLAACLTLFPRLLLFISESTQRRAALTPLESFLSIHFGVFLAAIALTLVLNIPSSSPPIPQTDAQPHQPVLIPLTIAAILSSFIAWNSRSVGALASIFFTVDITIGLWGLWAAVFANSSRISKTTGADKHTSSFIFGNSSSASKQKKQWLKQRPTPA